MNRLANALLFAVVVMTAFVLELRTSHPQYSPGHLLARVVQTARPAPAPVYVGAIPGAPEALDLDAADIQESVDRAQEAEAVLTKVKVRQIERHARMEARIAKAKCTVVRLDQ